MPLKPIKFTPNLLSFALVIVGILLFFPYHDYQLLLAPGDHGRDLYVFEQTLVKGALPFRDYWWNYGPIMPQYYSLFYKLFGINIQSVLIGKIVVQLTAGILFYRCLILLIPPVVAFAGTLWFWAFMPDFFHTYNHIGAVAGLLAVILCVFRYLQTFERRYLMLGLLGLFIVSMIKVNTGLFSLLAFIICVFIIDLAYKIPFSRAKLFFYLAGVIGLPLLVLSVYLCLLAGLPDYAVHQCLPYLGQDRPHHIPILTALWIYAYNIGYNIKMNPLNLIFAVIFNLCIFQTGYLILAKKLEERMRKQVLLAILVLLIFSAFNLHEYFDSGVAYRIYWAKPFDMLCMFLIIGTAQRSFRKIIRRIFLATIILLCFIFFYLGYQKIFSAHQPGQYLDLTRGKIYTNNDPSWIDTVKRTTHYLRTQLKEEELFFAFPYDPIYYFLAEKSSPYWQMVFFNHVNVPPDQEREIIAVLEKKRVNWIVLSSRAYAPEDPTLGVFGVTFCPILAKYFAENFETAATFGDWQNPPGWAWNHGTKILKRK